MAEIDAPNKVLTKEEAAKIGLTITGDDIALSSDSIAVSSDAPTVKHDEPAEKKKTEKKIEAGKGKATAKKK